MLRTGDLVLLDFSKLNAPSENPIHEVLVVNAGRGSATEDVQLASITTAIENANEDAITFSQGELVEGTVKQDCAVRVDQITTVKREYFRKVGRLGWATLDKVLRKQASLVVKSYAAERYTDQPFIPGQTTIPPSGKVIGESEIVNMVEASLDAWLTTGRFNDAFEKRLARFLGVRYALTVNSGSSANLLAFLALTSPKLGERAIKPGDEVISVAAGFPTTVNPILQYGAVPVFVPAVPLNAL